MTTRAQHFLSAPEVQREGIADGLKGWIMVLLTLIFVFLYSVALLGWLKPLADVTVVSRLEPIIFVIIGYYFGRLPAQQNEKTLKEEIARQTQRADAAQHVKEQAQQARESLEEKIKNVRAALAPLALSATVHDDDAAEASGKEIERRHTVRAALRVLNS